MLQFLDRVNAGLASRRDFFKKEPFSQSLFKEPSLHDLFIIWRTFFHHKEPFVKQKGSSDVKCSLWNHLEKKGSSMASWNTFIFKSVVYAGPLTFKCIILQKHEESYLRVYWEKWMTSWICNFNKKIWIISTNKTMYGVLLLIFE